VLVVGTVFQRAHVGASSAPHTALIEVRGEIAADTDASAEALLGAIKSAFDDPGAQAVVLRINSPGGSPVQAGQSKKHPPASVGTLFLHQLGRQSF